MSVDLRRLRNLATNLRERVEQSRSRSGGGSWYRIENAAAPVAEVYLYDMIGEWGVTAQDFINELRGVSATAIDLHVNSEGGEIFDGIAIYEALLQYRNRGGYVRSMVDGIAASSASFIVQAADERVMGRRSRMMIHSGQSALFGMFNADVLREIANLLDDLTQNIASIYQDRAGGSVASWLDAMRGPRGGDGTWYDAEAAVTAGLADSISQGPDSGGDSAQNRGGLPGELRPAFAEREEQMSAGWDPSALLSAFKDVERSVEEVNNPKPPINFDSKALIDMFREVAP